MIGLYKSDGVPEGYRCADCGAGGVRLWREYQVCHTELRCASCAENHERLTHDPGWSSGYSDGSSDQIGWLVPAVPCEEGGGFWGYSSVPQDGVLWWYRLPCVRPYGRPLPVAHEVRS